MQKKGFSLIELLIFTAIFTMIMVAFITILVTATTVQTKQLSSSEVEQQSQFLLQQIQYYVQASSLVDITQDTPTTTLRLRMANPAIDPTIFTLSNGVLNIQQGSNPATPLSSNKVVVSNLSFTRRANPGAHDAVNVGFTVAYNAGVNPKLAFTQGVQVSIARVSAATFDSNLLPSSTATYSIGSQVNLWNSLNGIINFANGNVGIGAISPQQALEVNGGVRLSTATTQPTCAAATSRGTLWLLAATTTAASDTLQLCVQAVGGSYTWVRIY